MNINSNSKRVEIKGQFDPNNPFTSFRSTKEPIAIDRQQLPFHDQPAANWNSFCDEVDTLLQDKLTRPRQLNKISLVLLILMIASILVTNLFVRGLFTGGDNEMDFVTYLIYLIPFIIMLSYFALYCKVFTSVRSTFFTVSEICTRYSIPDVVKYELRNEWWGGCSKLNSRRQFLVVTSFRIDNDGADIEQQHQQIVVPAPVQQSSSTDNHLTMNAVAYPTAGVSSTTTSGGNTTSLFDQLASGT